MIRTGILAILLAGLPLRALAAGVAIEKLLPFTPTADSVRVVTTVSGEATLSGKITPWRKDDIVWSGPLTADQTLDHLPVNAWSPGNPNLYELTVTASVDGKPEASKTVRFGFRQVESRNGNIHLNGLPIFLRG